MIPAWIMMLTHLAGLVVVMITATKFGETENMRYFIATIIAACFAIV